MTTSNPTRSARPTDTPRTSLEAVRELNATDIRRYSDPQPNVPDYCTETSFLVYDYATGATVLVPREWYR